MILKMRRIYARIRAGRMFDKDGNLRQWWTNSTVTEYVNRTACFTKQYGDYYVKEVDEHVSHRVYWLCNYVDFLV